MPRPYFHTFNFIDFQVFILLSLFLKKYRTPSRELYAAARAFGASSLSYAVAYQSLGYLAIPTKRFQISNFKLRFAVAPFPVSPDRGKGFCLYSFVFTLYSITYNL